METYELTVKDNNEVVVRKSKSVIIQRNTNIFLEEGILVENKETQTRVTLVDDLEEARKIVAENHPLKEALSVHVHNGHLYSDHSCVFDMDKVATLTESEDDLLEGLMRLVDDNEPVFIDNKKNVDRLLDVIKDISQVYSVEYIIRTLGNASINEFRDIIEKSENPLKDFQELVSGY